MPLTQDLQSGKIVPPSRLATVADATSGGVEEGAITFDLCKKVVSGFEILDEEGNILEEHHLGDYGWTDIVVCADGDNLLFSNIFNGKIAKYNLPSKEIIGWIDTGQAKPKRALAGIAEFPG